MGTFIVLALVALSVCLAARCVYRDHRRGGCCGGDCSNCARCSGRSR